MIAANLLFGLGFYYSVQNAMVVGEQTYDGVIALESKESFIDASIDVMTPSSFFVLNREIRSGKFYFPNMSNYYAREKIMVGRNELANFRYVGAIGDKLKVSNSEIMSEGMTTKLKCRLKDDGFFIPVSIDGRKVSASICPGAVTSNFQSTVKPDDCREEMFASLIGDISQTVFPVKMVKIGNETIQLNQNISWVSSSDKQEFSAISCDILSRLDWQLDMKKLEFSCRIRQDK